MADSDAGEREEQATPKRLQEARDKGQVARSKELTTALLLMAAATALYSFSNSIASDIGMIARKAFTPDRRYIFNPKQMLSALYELMSEAAVSVAPFFIVLFIIGLFSSAALGGFSFSTKALAPKANRMSIGKGLKRMFGMHALVELIKALAKISVVFLVGYLVMLNTFPTLTELGQGSIESGIAEAMDIVAQSFFLLSLSLIVIAFIDVPYQIWNHAKQLKMSKQEIKDEYKETEGRPEVKGKLRQKQRELSQQRMMDAVPEADVVVTNPEHFSVALKYDLMKSGAPIVVAKGADLIALQIRKVAAANDVHILPMPALARALFYTTEIDEEVPQGLYMSVAQILAFVFQLKSFNDGKGPRPDEPKKIDIPPEYRF
ncbi:MAG: flagellar biosynthesis protein FlhB [Kangiellaceae bacterium]|nr:flagellar biosynthesis protein FlhB [Kangiellaceae bacterium]